MPRPSRYTLLFLALLGTQAAFWHQARNIQPDMTVVPPPPGKAEVQALALGDDEFYFRALALQMQNFGDLFGRFTALRYYDFSRLYQWFVLLDALDSRSNMVPNTAAYYFSQTQNTPDVAYIVDYLYGHSTRDIGNKWWWLLQAMYLASYKLEDMDLTLKVAEPMNHPKVPPWARMMVAVVHEKRGEMQDALTIMNAIKENATDLTDADLRYMTYFVKERLHTLEEREKGGGASR